MCIFFFFNDTATTEIYTLSLHDALPILLGGLIGLGIIRPVNRVLGVFFRAFNRAFDWATAVYGRLVGWSLRLAAIVLDRKSTRLNSSHANISYAVFCLKKKINLLNTPFI